MCIYIYIYIYIERERERERGRERDVPCNHLTSGALLSRSNWCHDSSCKPPPTACVVTLVETCRHHVIGVRDIGVFPRVWISMNNVMVRPSVLQELRTPSGGNSPHAHSVVATCNRTLLSTLSGQALTPWLAQAEPRQERAKLKGWFARRLTGACTAGSRAPRVQAHDLLAYRLSSQAPALRCAAWSCIGINIILEPAPGQRTPRRNSAKTITRMACRSRFGNRNIYRLC